MNKKTRVLKANPEDVKQLTNLFYVTWLDTYPNRKYRITASDIRYHYRNMFKKEEILKRQKDIAHPKKGYHRFIAKIGNKIVGACNVILNSEKNKLKAIYVLPKYQRQGIGYMLWKKAIKTFNNNKKTIVRVAEYNQKAISFYEKLGFKKTNKKISENRFKMRNGAIIPEIEMVLIVKK